MFHIRLILSQGSCKGMAHALTGLGPPCTSWLVLTRIFCREMVDVEIGLCIGLDRPGTLWLILAQLFCIGLIHALTGLCIGLGPPGTSWLILA